MDEVGEDLITPLNLTGAPVTLPGALATVSMSGIANYVWALALIAVGGYLVFRFFTNR